MRASTSLQPFLPGTTSTQAELNITPSPFSQLHTFPHFVTPYCSNVYKSVSATSSSSWEGRDLLKLTESPGPTTMSKM